MESIIEQTYTKATKCAINLGINRVTLTLGKILVVLIYKQVLKLIVNMLVMSYCCFSHCLSFFFLSDLKTIATAVGSSLGALVLVLFVAVLVVCR